MMTSWSERIPKKVESLNFRLKEKYDDIRSKERRFEHFRADQDYEYLIVAFGSLARIAKGTVEMANCQGLSTSLFRPITVWPYPYMELKAAAAGAKKVFVFEMNLGQMLEDVKLALEDSDRIEFYGRTGGGVPTSEELLDFMQSKV